MHVSILIPVYNEEKTIAILLDRVFSISAKDTNFEFIIIDDGSSDKTAVHISSLLKKHQNKSIRHIRHEKNVGKGAAIRTGLSHAAGEYIIIQDADLEYDPMCIPELLKPIQQGKTHVVYGTRINRLPNFKGEERTMQFFIHYLGNRFLSLLTSILYGQWITDMETGYKVFPRKAVENRELVSHGFNIEPEITAKLLRQKYFIFEIPIATKPRSYKEGKKLRTWHDGWAALYTLIKNRIYPIA